MLIQFLWLTASLVFVGACQSTPSASKRYALLSNELNTHFRNNYVDSQPYDVPISPGNVTSPIKKGWKKIVQGHHQWVLLDKDLHFFRAF